MTHREEEQQKTPRRTWPPPLALLAPALHFSESKWTAKGREQPKIASLEFSSMPLLLPVIASLRSNRSPSSSFKPVQRVCTASMVPVALTSPVWEMGWSWMSATLASGVKAALQWYESLGGDEASAVSVCRVWGMQVSVSEMFAE